MKCLITLFLLSLLLQACSGGSIKRWSFSSSGDTELKDYKFIKGSRKNRPSWIEKPQSFGKRQDFFFSFETTPKTTKEIACNLVKAYARERIAEEITAFLTDKEDAKELWVQFARDKAFELFQESLSKAQILDEYWEQKRITDLTTGDDIDFYTCALLIQFQKEDFKNTVDELRKLIKNEFGPKKAIEMKTINWEDRFIKYRKGAF